MNYLFICLIFHNLHRKLIKTNVMVSAKQLAKHLSSNNLTHEEIEKTLTNFKNQEYSRGIQDAHNKLNFLKRKRKSITNQRLKEEWDTIITKLRDQLSK